MAKKKKNDEFDPVNSRGLMDSMWDAHASGVDTAVAAVSRVGLYIPHLCLRYLFCSTILPFERTLLAFGPPGSSKSSFLYWIYSLFLDNNGKYMHLDIEDKDTPLLRLSLTKFNRKDGRVSRCESMDHFQSETKKAFDTMTSVCAKSKMGKRVPFVVGIDSLTAKMTEDAYKTVDKADGVTGRRFADEARSLSDWFKVEPNYLIGWPFMLVGIRHDKPYKDANTGRDMHKAPGGTAPRYNATYEILLQKVKKLKANASGWEGHRIKMTSDKSSNGSDQRKIEAEIAWSPGTFVDKNGNSRPTQRTRWAWGKATVQTLEVLQSAGGPFGRAVDDLLGLRRITGGRYLAPGIGVKGDDNALKPAELAKLIEGNKDLLKELEPRIGIGAGVEFAADGEFDAQIAEARSRVDELIQPPYLGDESDESADDGDEGGGDGE